MEKFLLASRSLLFENEEEKYKWEKKRHPQSTSWDSILEKASERALPNIISHTRAENIFGERLKMFRRRKTLVEASTPRLCELSHILIRATLRLSLSRARAYPTCCRLFSVLRTSSRASRKANRALSWMCSQLKSAMESLVDAIFNFHEKKKSTQVDSDSLWSEKKHHKFHLLKRWWCWCTRQHCQFERIFNYSLGGWVSDLWFIISELTPSHSLPAFGFQFLIRHFLTFHFIGEYVTHHTSLSPSILTGWQVSWLILDCLSVVRVDPHTSVLLTTQ